MQMQSGQLEQALATVYAGAYTATIANKQDSVSAREAANKACFSFMTTMEHIYLGER